MQSLGYEGELLTIESSGGPVRRDPLVSKTAPEKDGAALNPAVGGGAGPKGSHL